MVVGLVVAVAAVVAWPGAGDDWADGVVELPDPPRDMVVADGAAWVSFGDTDSEARLARIDLSTGETTVIPGTTGAFAVAAGGEGVWVSVCARIVEVGCRGRAIARVDPSSASVRARTDVEGHNVDLAVDRGLVWASMSSPDQIVAFDADTLDRQRSVPSVGSGFTVAQDAAWGIWQMGRVPEVRMWPRSHDLSQPLTSPPTEPLRVRVEDACALAAGATTAWVVECRRVELPAEQQPPTTASPSGTVAPPTAGSELVIHALDPEPVTIASFAVPDATSPMIVEMDPDALVVWIDVDRGTLEVRGVGSARARGVQASIAVGANVGGMFGPPPPSVSVVDPAGSSIAYVALAVGEEGRLLRVALG